MRAFGWTALRVFGLATLLTLLAQTPSPIVHAQSGPPPLTPFHGLIDHVSVNQWGFVPTGNTQLGPHSISGDGRFVVMQSTAGDLVAGDYNGMDDVFLRDRMTGTTTRISVALYGGDPDGMSQVPAISANGRHVAFASGASNLIADDTNNTWDVFVRDLDQDRTVRVSIATDGTQSDRDSGWPAISADGRFVAFVSMASTLAPGIAPYQPMQAYIHDRDADGNGVFDEAGGTSTSLVSVSYDASIANANVFRVRVSDDGRLVLFETTASNIDPVGNPNSWANHLYVRDRQLNQTLLVDRAVTGGPAGWGVDFFTADMSGDGRFITFTSISPDIVPLDMNWISQVFIYDALAAPGPTTSIVSALPNGSLADGSSTWTSVSADGRYVAFATNASNLATPPAASNAAGLIVRDRNDGTFARVDVIESGAPFDQDYPYYPSISADGTAVAFQSNAVNAVNGWFTWGSSHVFVATAFAAAPESASYSGVGGGGSIEVNTTAVSGWTAVSMDPWIVLMDGLGFGAGPRTVSYLVDSNSSGVVRDGHIRLGSKTFTIHQDGDGDLTPPVITPFVSGMLGGDGWYVGPVTVQWSVGDPESEILSQSFNCGTLVTIDTDTIYAPVTCEATSHGGTSSRTVVIRRDTAGPTIAIATPEPTAYVAGATIVPSFSCTDASGYSGVDICHIVEGSSPLDTTPGRHLFAVTAVDRAGNVSSKQVEYIVGTGACVPPNGTLAAWWRFENDTADALGHLVAVPTPETTLQYADGLVGRSWQAQSTSYLDTFDGDRLLASNGLTVAAWIRPTGAIGESATIVSKPAQYRIARYPDGTLRWAFSHTDGYNWVNTGVVIPGNVWTHIAVSYNAGLVNTYVNGRLVHSRQLTGTLISAGDESASMTIGGRADASASYFGWLDELEVYTSPLSGDDIAALALAGNGGSCVPKSTTLAIAVPATVEYGATFPVTVTLRDDAGSPLVSRNVVLTSFVSADGTSVGSANGTTDASGQFSTNLPIATSAAAGAYEHGVTASFAGDPYDTPSQAQSTVTIVRATPTITWPAPAPIVYGTALGAAQLNASASIAGTFAYSPAAGTVLDAGTQPLSATFTPSDADRWATVTSANTIVVAKAAATMSLADATFTYDSQPHGASVAVTGINNQPLTPVVVTYNGSTTVPTNAGTYAVEARYDGSANYLPVSRTATLTIVKAGTTLTWPTPANIVYGTPLGAAQLNATANVPGTFVYSPTAGSVLSAGPYTLSVTFTPTDTSNYTGSSATRPLTVTAAPLALTTNSVSKPYGAPLPAFSVTPSGFVNGDTMASLAGTLGFATSATATSPVGAYAVTPQGVSSPNYTIAFVAGTLTIARASTTLAVAASPNPDGLNQSVTLTAAVAVVAPGAGVPTGVVQFFDGGTLLGAASIAAGSASLTTNGFSSGTHAISATYGGDAAFAPSSGNGSLVVNTATNSSSTVVTSSANPSTAGQSVTLTATLTAPSGATGNVAFYDGANPIGTAALSGTTARLTTSALANGGHAITARYLGNATVPPSTSPAFAQYVQPSGAHTKTSTTALAASPSPATLGANVTLTATVTVSQSQTPTGQVTFFVNGVVVGQGTLGGSGSTATATFSTSTLPHGTHKVEAVYLGDATYRASTRAISLVVN